jgi:UDP-glucose 4-epimerase
MSKNIVVTGGAGFIGSHVVDLLVANKWDVHIIDNLSTGQRVFVNPKAKLHECDIRDAMTKKIIGQLRPKSVIHLAAQVDLRRSVGEPSYDADINLVGGLKVLEACRAAKVKHIIFASSAAVYSAVKQLPFKETVPTVPASPYGIAKMTFEHYLRVEENIAGVKNTCLRFANVYGPRQTVHGEAGVVAIFLARLFAGQPCFINGDGRQTRDYIYVGDVARMVVIAAQKGLQGTYNVSTGIQTDVNHIYSGLAAAVGVKISAHHGPAKLGEDRRVALDPSKARRAVGWKAEIKLEDGLYFTKEWMDRTVKAGRLIR